MNIKTTRFGFMIALGALCIALTAGCGGGGHDAAPAGRLQLTIDWPQQGRIIPEAAQSLTVDVAAGATALGHHTIARPPAGQNSTNDVFTGLPAGPVTVSVAAFPNADGTGVAQATGAAMVTIVAGSTASVRIDPASTIARVVLAPASRTLTPGGTVQVVATALDAQDRVVLTAPSKWIWSTSAPTIAGVTATGPMATVTGTAAGQAAITARETESNVSGQASITVVAPRVENWTKFHHDNRNTGMGTGSGAAGTLAWTFNAGSLVFASPALSPSGDLLVGANDGTMTALNSATGQSRWAFKAGGGISSSPAIGPNGLVYFGAGDGKVYALDIAGGAKVWEFQTGSSIFDSSPALGADGTVYIGSNDGNLYALDGTSGQQKWAFKTGAAIFSSPAVGTDGTVYIGSNDFKLYAVNGGTGSQKWVFQMSDEVHSSPAVGSDGTVYVGSTTDHKVYALDGQTGAKRWEFLTGNFVDSSPAVGSNGVVYVGGGDQKVYALDAATGAQKWSFATGSRIESSPAIGADFTVYIGSNDQQLYALDGQTGAKKWQVQPGTGPVKSSPAIGADGTIYIASNEGTIRAVR